MGKEGENDSKRLNKKHLTEEVSNTNTRKERGKGKKRMGQRSISGIPDDYPELPATLGWGLYLYIYLCYLNIIYIWRYIFFSRDNVSGVIQRTSLTIYTE